MAERRLYTVRVSAFRVPCGECKALAGQKCRFGDTVQERPHVSRMQSALRSVAASKAEVKRLMPVLQFDDDYILTWKKRISEAKMSELLRMKSSLVKLSRERPRDNLKIGALIGEVNQTIRARRGDREAFTAMLFVRAAHQALAEEDFYEILKMARGEADRHYSSGHQERRPMTFDPELLFAEFGRDRVLNAYSVACQQGTRPTTVQEMRDLLGDAVGLNVDEVMP